MLVRSGKCVLFFYFLLARVKRAERVERVERVVQLARSERVVYKLEIVRAVRVKREVWVVQGLVSITFLFFSFLFF